MVKHYVGIREDLPKLETDELDPFLLSRQKDQAIHGVV